MKYVTYFGIACLAYKLIDKHFEKVWYGTDFSQVSATVIGGIVSVLICLSVFEFIKKSSHKGKRTSKSPRKYATRISNAQVMRPKATKTKSHSDIKPTPQRYGSISDITKDK